MGAGREKGKWHECAGRQREREREATGERLDAPSCYSGCLFSPGASGLDSAGVSDDAASSVVPSKEDENKE